MGPVNRVDVHILGVGNYPEAFVKLPTDLVKDLPTYMDRVKKISEFADEDDLIRAIWEYGLRTLNGNLARGIFVHDKS